MGIKITSVREAVEDTGIKILVHGMAGAGKTVLCATTGAPTLIISAESGLLSIKHAPSYIQTTEIKTIDELEEVYDYLANEDHDFEWACLDSISEIAEVVLSNEKALSKDPRQAYGNLQDRMTKILRMFRDLPMNIVMSCKMQRRKDEDTGITSFVPMLPGQGLTNSIAYLFDEVFALRVEKDDDGEDYRVVQTNRDRNYEAKDRSGLLDMFEEPSIKKIAAKIHGEKSPEEKVEQAKEQKIERAVEDGMTVINDTEKKMYFFHAESEALLVLEPGEEFKNDGLAEQVTYKQYLNIKKQLEEDYPNGDYPTEI